jgi:hypothetical protein
MRPMNLMEPTPAERQAIVSFQVTDLADDDGMVLVYDFSRGRFRAVDVPEGIRLCLAGQACPNEWPKTEHALYLTFIRGGCRCGSRGIEDDLASKRARKVCVGPRGR